MPGWTHVRRCSSLEAETSVRSPLLIDDLDYLSSQLICKAMMSGAAGVDSSLRTTSSTPSLSFTKARALNESWICESFMSVGHCYVSDLTLRNRGTLSAPSSVRTSPRTLRAAWQNWRCCEHTPGTASVALP